MSEIYYFDGDLYRNSGGGVHVQITKDGHLIASKPLATLSRARFWSTPRHLRLHLARSVAD